MLNESQANWAVSLIGLFSTIGRVGIGPVCDWARPRRYLLALYVAINMISAASMALLPLAHNASVLYLVCGLFGFTNGASVTVEPVIIEYYVEPKDLAKVRPDAHIALCLPVVVS
jgi:MFS family permease